MAYELALPCGHELPTNTSAQPYDGPGACLRHLYEGALRPPAPVSAASARPFAQQPFGAAAADGWAEEGLVYVPAACAAAGARCALHVHLHDCGTRDAPVAPPGASLGEVEAEFAK